MRSGRDLCCSCRHLRNSHGWRFKPGCKVWGCECYEFQEIGTLCVKKPREPEDVEVTIEEATAFLDED